MKSLFLIFSFSFSRSFQRWRESCAPLLQVRQSNTRGRRVLTVSWSCCLSAELKHRRGRVSVRNGRARRGGERAGDGGGGGALGVFVPVRSLKRLLASARSTESKYQTVMAYLRQTTTTLLTHPATCRHKHRRVINNMTRNQGNKDINKNIYRGFCFYTCVTADGAKYPSSVLLTENKLTAVY